MAYFGGSDEPDQAPATPRPGFLAPLRSRLTALRYSITFRTLR